MKRNLSLITFEPLLHVGCQFLILINEFELAKSLLLFSVTYNLRTQSLVRTDSMFSKDTAPRKFLSKMFPWSNTVGEC